MKDRVQRGHKLGRTSENKMLCHQTPAKHCKFIFLKALMFSVGDSERETQTQRERAYVFCIKLLPLYAVPLTGFLFHHGSSGAQQSADVLDKG